MRRHLKPIAQVVIGFMLIAQLYPAMAGGTFNPEHVYDSPNFLSQPMLTSYGSVFFLESEIGGNRLRIDNGLDTGIAVGQDFFGLGSVNNFDSFGAVLPIAYDDMRFLVHATLNDAGTERDMLATLKYELTPSLSISLDGALFADDPQFPTTDNRPVFSEPFANRVDWTDNLTLVGGYRGDPFSGPADFYTATSTNGSMTNDVMVEPDLTANQQILNTPFVLMYLSYLAFTYMAVFQGGFLLNGAGLSSAVLFVGLAVHAAFNPLLGSVIFTHVLLPIVLATILMARPGSPALFTFTPTQLFEVSAFVGALVLMGGFFEDNGEFIDFFAFGSGATAYDGGPAPSITGPNPADLDGDGVVDNADFSFLSGCITGGNSGDPIPAGCEPADLDEDGDVDHVDFAILVNRFDAPAFPAAAKQAGVRPTGGNGLQFDPQYKNAGIGQIVLQTGDPVPGVDGFFMNSITATGGNGWGTGLVRIGAANAGQTEFKDVIIVFNECGYSVPVKSGDDLGNGKITSLPAISNVNQRGQFAVVAALVSGARAVYRFSPVMPDLGLTFTEQPQDQNVDKGSTFQLRAQFQLQFINGPTNNLTMRWKRNGVPVLDDGRITGAQTTELTVQAAGLADEGDYTLEVTDTTTGAESETEPAMIRVIDVPEENDAQFWPLWR